MSTNVFILSLVYNKEVIEIGRFNMIPPILST